MIRNLVVSAAILGAPVVSAGLVVTEVMPQTTTGTPSTINGDWWELTNSGPATVNLGGYQWADTEDALPGPDSNFFPAISIGVGESIIITEELSADVPAWRTNWGMPASVVVLGADNMVDDSTPEGDTFSGLGSTNDGVFFYDPAGTLLSSYAWVANTRGVTFEADQNGTDLGLSVVGQNGAVLGANGDIGSPGTSVPEPASLALLGLGAAALIRRRR